MLDQGSAGQLTSVVLPAGPLPQQAGRSEAELCACAPDGVSNGVPTGRRGCARHGLPTFPTRHCYVVGGALCPTAQASPSFPGAAWREC